MLKFNKKQILKYGAVVGLLVFLYFSGWIQPIINMVNYISNPFLVNLYSLSVNWRHSSFGEIDYKDLIIENRKLKKELNFLLQENARLQIMEDENKHLRESLNFLNKKKYNYVIGQVISRGELIDFSGRAEEISINKGSRDGVSPGLVVLDSQGIVIGKVAAVKEMEAKIYLTTNKQCRLAATVLGQDKTDGVTEGELGLTIKMNFIPQDTKIKTGDIVVTSGLEQHIPHGLIIGRVTEVNKESSELWQTARLNALSDFNKLTTVSVILP